MKKKYAVMVADTRPALIGHILLQIKKTNPDLFSEALIYYYEMSDTDKNALKAIMPCRFVAYQSPLPRSLFEKERFKRFTDIMFARYEMFKYLDEFDGVLWTDTDVLIQGDLSNLFEKMDETGIAFVREDPVNKTAQDVDYMRNCFINYNQVPAGYDMMAYLLCSGLIAVNSGFNQQVDYAAWCYQKTDEWADMLSLPDQGVLNALVQEFQIPLTPLEGKKYCRFPYKDRDCSDAVIIHTWGTNKFWNDWYLFNCYPEWNEYYKEWLKLGGSPLPFKIAPTVSVVIPVFKPKLNYFKECLDGLLSQQREVWERYSDFEILIVTEPFNVEELKDFVESYNDPRLNLIINKERLGIAASLNKGLRLAKGKYIARMDDDDLLAPDRLIKQVRYLDSHPEVELCTSDFNYFGDMTEHRISFEGARSKAWSIFTCPFDHPTIMFRKDFFADNNLFYDENRGYVEDWELWLRAFKAGMRVGCIHETLFYHRWHNGSAGQNKKTFEMMQDLVRKNFEALEVEIPLSVLPYVGPWNGRLDQQKLDKLTHIFDEALKNNFRIGIYDSSELWYVFSLRLEEARTGKLPDIVEPIYEFQNGPSGQNQATPSKWKSLLKRWLRPLYNPFKWRYEDRLIAILGKADQIQSAQFAQVEQVKKELHQISFEVCKHSWAQDKLEIELSNYSDKQSDKMEHLDDKLIELSKQIECATNLIQQVEWRSYDFKTDFDFLKQCILNNSSNKKKIFLIGTPTHENIGDAAIACGTKVFIQEFFPEYFIVEIPTTSFVHWYGYILSMLGQGDMIFLQGGGSLGNQYLIEEELRRMVISKFQNVPIVILPQTVHFTNDKNGEQELKLSQAVYNQHQNLTIFTRGEVSKTLATKYFSKAKIYSTLDMALIIQRKFNNERNGALLCLRGQDAESVYSNDDYHAIEAMLVKLGHGISHTANVADTNIPMDKSWKYVENQLELFSRHKVVVTDRLHGLIFAVITQTPCVVLGTYNHKIREFVQLLNGSNAVFFVEKNEVEEALIKALQIEDAILPYKTDAVFAQLAEDIIKSQRK